MKSGDLIGQVDEVGVSAEGCDCALDLNEHRCALPPSSLMSDWLAGGGKTAAGRVGRDAKNFPQLNWVRCYRETLFDDPVLRAPLKS